MIVSIASGKGGTGKTTVAASLATVWDAPVAAVDLDVEEPNLHLFLRPEMTGGERVDLEIPLVDLEKCDRCRACAQICQFKAITVMGPSLMIFPDMCHGCGGCLAVCPHGALTPGGRELGTVESGWAGTPERPIRFLSGRLRVGEAMSPPLMRAVRGHLAKLTSGGLDAVLDSPPGVSCPAISSVLDSDVIVLVTEPTPFGFHDFKLAVEAFTPLGKPLGAVVNRAGSGDSSVQDYCRTHDLPILAELPYDRAVAEAYARGQVIADLNPEQRERFTALRQAVRQLAGQEARHA